MDRLAELYLEILEEIGENPEREGLRKTPRRAAAAMRTLLSGYGQSPKEIMEGAIFESECDDMVIVKDIEFYSMCEHHLLPFYGRCHIGYIPAGRIIGLSKLARLVDLFARRLQVQERMTHQIAHTLLDVLKPEGVGVVVEAFHLCMMSRGVQKQNSKAITSAVLGSFRTDRAVRSEFMDLIKASRT